EGLCEATDPPGRLLAPEIGRSPRSPSKPQAPQLGPVDVNSVCEPGCIDEPPRPLKGPPRYRPRDQGAPAGTDHGGAAQGSPDRTGARSGPAQGRGSPARRHPGLQEVSQPGPASGTHPLQCRPGAGDGQVRSFREISPDSR